MTTALAGASFDSLPPEEKAALRHAMLSVYYLSVGSQLESRGAPVMAVPPDVRPLPLDAALAKLEPHKGLLGTRIGASCGRCRSKAGSGVASTAATRRHS